MGCPPLRVARREMIAPRRGGACTGKIAARCGRRYAPAGQQRGTVMSSAGRQESVTRQVPTYQVLAEDIKALGVEQVFGLMSDDTAVFATALDSSGVRFYGARHEN